MSKKNAQANLEAVTAESKAPTIKTTAYGFYSAGHVSKNQRLFSVTPGIEIGGALQEVTNLLDIAREPVFNAGMGSQPLEHNAAWAVLHVLESAKAVVDALLCAIPTDTAYRADAYPVTTKG